MAQKERLSGAGVERAVQARPRSRFLPGPGEIGAADCHPHVPTGRRSTAVKSSSAKRSGKRKAKTPRQSPGLRSLGDARNVGDRRRKRSRAKLRSTGDTRPVR
jgi:hypothetical protein